MLHSMDPCSNFPCWTHGRRGEQSSGLRLRLGSAAFVAPLLSSVPATIATRLIFQSFTRFGVAQGRLSIHGDAASSSIFEPRPWCGGD